MKRLKASAALVCTLLMGWSQIIQPYSAYALSVQAAAASQSVSQTSNEYESQGASSQGAQDDASGSQGVTEWYGDDANAARPDGGVDSDSGEQPGIGIEESRVDESNGEAPTDDSTEMNSCEADSLEPNSWRFENGVLIDSDNGDIDAQSLTDDPLPMALLRAASMSAIIKELLIGIRLRPRGLILPFSRSVRFTENLTILLKGTLLNVNASAFLMACITTPTPVL